MNLLRLKDVETRNLMPGCGVRFIHSGNMTFAYWDLEPGVGVPEHSHPHEQVAHVLEGEFDLTVDGETQRLSPGCVVIIPPHAVHSGGSVTTCRVLDVFYPVREDYR
ncbi:MAG: cupin domain-containing protein [Deltaproteobacteria bacterium]|nr:cupin domain-containing protein [Deltaproteobacteria bacterium]